jgi:hypothetical protein
MPLAWEMVAVQFGYVGLRLWECFGKTGLLMIGLLGAINIPFYEEMARRIHWWQYSGCRMISYTPWYIIVGEFGIALVFALVQSEMSMQFSSAIRRFGRRSMCARRFTHGKANTISLLRIVTKRSGKIEVLWRLRCCAPTSMLALGNTPKD